MTLLDRPLLGVSFSLLVILVALPVDLHLFVAGFLAFPAGQGFPEVGKKPKDLKLLRIFLSVFDTGMLFEGFIILLNIIILKLYQSITLKKTKHDVFK